MRQNPEEMADLVTVLGIHGNHNVHHPQVTGNVAPLSVQEWTGQGWAIVEVLDGAGLVEPTPLDASSFPGLYVGQRVVTA